MSTTPLTRSELLAHARWLLDYLRRHPDIPVCRLVARGGYLYGDRDDLLKQLRDHADRLEHPVLLDDGYSVVLQDRVADEVFWEVVVPDRQTVCTPRIDGGKVVWDLPELDIAHVAREVLP